MEFFLERCKADLDRSWFTTNDKDRERCVPFVMRSPVSVNERIVRNKQRKIGTDMAVPDRMFPGSCGFIKSLSMQAGLNTLYSVTSVTITCTPICCRRTPPRPKRRRHLYGRFVAQAIMMGGTVSAEHGIGKLKKKYLKVMMGERYLNEMAELKRAFDPNGILNSGNMFDA